jgi:hypothetical protein
MLRSEWTKVRVETGFRSMSTRLAVMLANWSRKPRFERQPGRGVLLGYESRPVSLAVLIRTIGTLTATGVALRSLRGSIDTTTTTVGQMFIGIEVLIHKHLSDQHRLPVVHGVPAPETTELIQGRKAPRGAGVPCTGP